MKILDRYILTEFLLSFLGILAVFALIILLNQILGTLNAVRVENPNLYQIGLFFLNSLPGQLLQVTPISVILAAMFGVGALAKRKELLAMHASGISYLRLAVPLAVIMAVIAFAVLIVGQILVPDCEQRARYIETVDIKGKSTSVLTKNKNITTRGIGNLFYDMKSFDDRTKIMELPVITELSDNGHSIKMRLDAQWAQMVTSEGLTSATATAQANPKVASKPSTKTIQGETAKAGGEETLYWHFHNAIRWKFDEAGNLLSREKFDDLEIPMEEDLDRFLSTSKKKQEMRYWELREEAAIQGQRVQSGYYFGIQTELYNRIAFPFAALLLGLIGYTLAVRSSIRSYVLEFGLALVYIAAYYVLMIFGNRAGSTGFIPPIIAAWYTNIIFFGLLIWRFHELNRVPR